jgi:DNA-binding CsgD family transcriptional regulator
MSEQLLRELNENLRTLVRLNALAMISGRSQREQIHLLSQGGFTPKQIAELIGTSANTVSVELSRKRQEKARGAK